MEFRSLTNIETSFKQIRLYAAAFVVLCIVITGIVVYSGLRVKYVPAGCNNTL